MLRSSVFWWLMFFDNSGLDLTFVVHTLPGSNMVTWKTTTCLVRGWHHGLPNSGPSTSMLVSGSTSESCSISIVSIVFRLTLLVLFEAAGRPTSTGALRGRSPRAIGGLPLPDVTNGTAVYAYPLTPKTTPGLIGSAMECLGLVFLVADM